MCVVVVFGGRGALRRGGLRLIAGGAGRGVSLLL